MDDDAEIRIALLLNFDEQVQGASDERRRLCGVLPIGEYSVAEKFVHNAAGGLNGVPALP